MQKGGEKMKIFEEIDLIKIDFWLHRTGRKSECPFGWILGESVKIKYFFYPRETILCSVKVIRNLNYLRCTHLNNFKECPFIPNEIKEKLF